MASASSGRSSSKASRRARPWRWCAPSTIPPRRAGRCGRMVREVRAAAILASMALCLPAPGFAARDFAPLLRQPGVKAALAYLRADDARTLEEQIAITQIPAPTFAERSSSCSARDSRIQLR